MNNFMSDYFFNIDNEDNSLELEIDEAFDNLFKDVEKAKCTCGSAKVYGKKTNLHARYCDIYCGPK